MASLRTLGYLAEFIEGYVPKDLSDEQLGSMLHATVCNIDGACMEITRVATQAL